MDVKHTEQTNKQPVWFRCPNPECVPLPEPGKRFVRYFDFQTKDDLPVCPRCGIGPPHVQKRSLIHLLLKNQKGKILGQGGLRYSIACDPGRETLATGLNGEAMTGDSRACNCDGCLNVIGDRYVQNGYGVYRNDPK